jgi:hypothetical protein
MTLLKKNLTAETVTDSIPLMVCTSNGVAIAPVQSTKRCGRCGDVKSIAAFNREARKKDGRSAWCKACKSRDQQKRRVEVLLHDPAWVERRKTYAKLARLIEKGAMEKPRRCPQCHNDVAVREMHASFKDGLDPFSVVWRCRTCTLAGLGKSMVKVCAWCDEPFRAQTHQLRRGAARYCSVRCRNAWMKATAEHVHQVKARARRNAQAVYLDDRF